MTKEKPLWFFLERYNDAFIAEECSFVEACLNGTDTVVGAFESPDEARRAAEAEAIIARLDAEDAKEAAREAKQRAAEDKDKY